MSARTRGGVRSRCQPRMTRRKLRRPGVAQEKIQEILAGTSWLAPAFPMDWRFPAVRTPKEFWPEATPFQIPGGDPHHQVRTSQNPWMICSLEQEKLSVSHAMPEPGQCRLWSPMLIYTVVQPPLRKVSLAPPELVQSRCAQS